MYLMLSLGATSLLGNSQSAFFPLDNINIQDSEINKLIKKQVATWSKHLRVIKPGFLCGAPREMALASLAVVCI